MIKAGTAPNDEHALTNLWDVKIMRRQNATVYMVASSAKPNFHRGPCLPPVMSLKIGDVFQEYISGLVVSKNLEHPTKQIAPLWTIQSVLITSL